MERIIHSFRGARTVLFGSKWSARGQARSSVTERYRRGNLRDLQEPCGARPAEGKDVRPDREDPYGPF